MVETQIDTSLNGSELRTTQYGDESNIALRGITRVLIGGFDNAGKSTLACSLYKALEHQSIDTSLYELDRWSDTHEPILGIKSWDERNKQPEVSIEEYAEYAQKFASDTSNLVLGDIEGRFQGPHNRVLKGSADFGILLTRDPIPKDKETAFLQTHEGWENLFDELNVPIAVRAYSTLNGEPIPPGHIRIPNLERKLVSENPGVQKLARMVVQLALAKEETNGSTS